MNHSQYIDHVLYKMGRFYDGDIRGKFWFGIQSSNDVENLITIDPYNYYCWHVCNCVVELDSIEFCSGCYETKDQHIEAAIEEEIYEDELLCYEECTHGYNINKTTHYQELIDNMEKLKNKIPSEIISEFEKIEQNDKILDAFTHVFDKTHLLINKLNDDFIYVHSEKNTLAILVARYTLGYQIEYCLRTTDYCNINCEY